MKASVLLKDTPHYRASAVRSGLRRLGFSIVDSAEADVCVMWNRYGWRNDLATRMQKDGRPVIVMENGYLGNLFAGSNWYSASLWHHNGAGAYPFHGPERWDRLGVVVNDWKRGSEVVLLPQRGIGPPGVAMPDNWVPSTQRALKAWKPRVRYHPGRNSVILPLDEDLSNASCVVTWGSTAALKALLIGVPAYYELDNWIGRDAATHISRFGDFEHKDRVSMFQKLAWAMWTVEEIESGFAFDSLMRCAK